jgi:N-acetylglucosaminyl-diphospho-decaprenol L-rhamnosyltransferase
MKDLGIVIVNWNTHDFLARCLESLMVNHGPSVQVVVVDNASTDGSAAMVQARFPSVQLINNPINGGFSYGNNIGLRALGYGGMGAVSADAPRYALLLNPDTTVPPDALARMVAWMDAHPEIGVGGPRLMMDDHQLDKACRRGLPTPEVAFYHYSGLARLFPHNPRFGRYNMTFVAIDQSIAVDSVVGAYMQVRRECIDAVGLLDEQFFMYGEDIDWCYRIQQRGWQVWYYADVTVYHHKRAASRKSQNAQFEFWRSMLLFYRKHFQSSTPLPVHGLVLLALLFKGGRQLWPDIFPPQSNAPQPQ